jgi:hypothetical protein
MYVGIVPKQIRLYSVIGESFYALNTTWGVASVKEKLHKASISYFYNEDEQAMLPTVLEINCLF